MHERREERGGVCQDKSRPADLWVTIRVRCSGLFQSFNILYSVIINCMFIIWPFIRRGWGWTHWVCRRGRPGWRWRCRRWRSWCASRGGTARHGENRPQPPPDQTPVRPLVWKLDLSHSRSDWFNWTSPGPSDWWSQYWGRRCRQPPGWGSSSSWPRKPWGWSPSHSTGWWWRLWRWRWRRFFLSCFHSAWQRKIFMICWWIIFVNSHPSMYFSLALTATVKVRRRQDRTQKPLIISWHSVNNNWLISSFCLSLLDRTSDDQSRVSHEYSHSLLSLLTLFPTTQQRGKWKFSNNSKPNNFSFRNQTSQPIEQFF